MELSTMVSAMMETKGHHVVIIQGDNMDAVQCTRCSKCILCYKNKEGHTLLKFRNKPLAKCAH